MLLLVGVSHAHPAAQLPRRGPHGVGDAGRRRARRHAAVGLGGDHGAVARGGHAAAAARRPGRAPDARGRRVRARTPRTSSGSWRRAVRRPARRSPRAIACCGSPPSTTAAESFVPGLMQAFSARHPGVRLGLSVGNRGQVLDWLVTHEADIAFGGRPPNDERLDARPFRPNELVLVSAADDPLAGGAPGRPRRARRAHVAAARARLRDAVGQRGVPLGQRPARRDADRRLQRRDPPGGPDRPRDLVPVGRRRDVGRRRRPARRDRDRSGAPAPRVARDAPRRRPPATAGRRVRRVRHRVGALSTSLCAAATAACPKLIAPSLGGRRSGTSTRRPRVAQQRRRELEQQAVLPHAAGEHDGVQAARAGGLGARLRGRARDRAMEARRDQRRRRRRPPPAARRRRPSARASSTPPATSSG